MKQFIYADNAATTRLDIDVFEAMKPFLLEEYANPSQQYSCAGKTRRAIREARARIARCINADPEEIYFTSGGTESNNWAIKGTAQSVKGRHTVITSQTEHRSVLSACKNEEKPDSPVIYLPVTKEGIVTPDTLRSFINSDTRLVSVMLGNNEIGSIEPVRELCEEAHRHGALFHTDAVGALGHIPVDVKELGVDMLSASAHKFGGPKGTGCLYIKKGTPVTAYVSGGAQESGMRGGTENTAAIVGMSVALQKSCNAISENTEHLKKLEKLILDTLSASGADFIRNGGDPRLPGHLSLSFRNADGEALLHRLDLMGIAVSTGAACDSKKTQTSHVLRAIGLTEEYAKGTIRITLSAENTPEEAQIISENLISIINGRL